MSISVPRLEALPAKGNYTLIIFLKAPTRIKMAEHRWLNLKKGYYAYTGSAMGRNATSLRRRVARHLGNKKKQHWHIDYLLASRKSSVTTVVAAASAVNKECEITSLLKRVGATVPIIGFGASDCKGKCKSHLVYFGKGIRVEAIADSYKSVFGGVQTLGKSQGSKREEKSDVTIETATPRNLEEMLRIERECFTTEAYTREQILNLLKNRDVFAQIARVNSDAVGFVTGLVYDGKEAKTGHIVTIDVAVAYRRRGLGLTLLKKAESILKKRGVKTIYLEVRVDNQPALKLYHKQGYVETESLKHYYSAGIHGLRLVKQL